MSNTNVKAIKQKMFDNFQIKGYWRLPESSTEIPGILFYEQDQIYLELLGVLKQDDGLFLNTGPCEIILGYSDKGEEFTLLDATIKSSTGNFPGYSTCSYNIESILVGGHFNNKEEMIFHSGIINTTFLTKWINRPVFESRTTFEEGTNNVLDRQLNIVENPIFKSYIPSINSTVEESYIYNFSGDLSESVNWTHTRLLKITPDENENISVLLHKMKLIKDLLSLFIGDAIYFNSIAFYGEEYKLENTTKIYRKKYNYFFRQNTSKLKVNFKQSEIMISFSEIENSFSQILNLWFEKHKLLETVYDFYFSYFYKDIYLDTTFLNSVQTLEIYHRRSFDGKIFDKKQYKESVKQVKEYLNNNLPEAFAKKISDMLAFGNEYSLAMRLEEIINSFDEDTIDCLIGNDEDVKKFIRQLVDTRNYLTHYDANKKKNLLDGIERKFIAIRRLHAITTVILFKEIGLDEEFVINKIKNSKNYSYVLNQAKKILN